LFDIIFVRPTMNLNSDWLVSLHGPNDECKIALDDGSSLGCCLPTFLQDFPVVSLKGCLCT